MHRFLRQLLQLSQERRIYLSCGFMTVGSPAHDELVAELEQEQQKQQSSSQKEQ